MNYNELVEHYIRFRDKRAEYKAEFDAKVQKIDLVLEKIEQKLMAHMNETGLESLRTGAGTAYRSIKTTASVADRDIFLDFVRENDAWELLETRAAKKAIEDYRAANDELPPGVNWSAVATINVRRSA